MGFQRESLLTSNRNMNVTQFHVFFWFICYTLMSMCLKLFVYCISWFCMSWVDFTRFNGKSMLQRLVTIATINISKFTPRWTLLVLHAMWPNHCCHIIGGQDHAWEICCYYCITCGEAHTREMCGYCHITNG
jgi:hypothetical protein